LSQYTVLSSHLGCIAILIRYSLFMSQPLLF